MDTRATIFVTLTAICCLACACGKVDAPQAAKQVVEVDVSMDRTTVSRVSVLDNRFDDGDQFRFFFNSAVPTNDDSPTSGGGDTGLKITDYKYEDSNKKWETISPIYWDDYRALDRYFCAVLPFSGYSASDHTFTVQSDQSVAEQAGYKASDLLMARVMTDKRLIPLKFYHVMAKVVVEVKASTDVSEPDAFSETAFANMTACLGNIQPKGKITFGVLDGAESDYDPKISVLSDGNTGKVSMLRLSEPKLTGSELSMQFTALIPPQTVGKGETFLTFSHVEGTNEKTYYMKAPEGGATFEQGKSTSVTVTLKKQQVEIDEVDTFTTIVDWSKIIVSHDPPIVLD